MPRSKLLSYIVGGVIVDENDQGEIVAKLPLEPVEIHGRAALELHLKSIDQLIADRTKELNPPKPRPKTVPKPAAKR